MYTCDEFVLIFVGLIKLEGHSYFIFEPWFSCHVLHLEKHVSFISASFYPGGLIEGKARLGQFKLY